MIVEWFAPARPTLEWFGQTSGTLASIERSGTTAVASVIGPPGVGADDALLAVRRLAEFDTAPARTQARTNLELEIIDLGTFN